MMMTRNLVSMVLGIALIVVGIAISYKTLLSLGIALIGIILMVIGIGLLAGRR